MKHGIKAILLVARRRAAKIQLGAQPPIENIDTLLGAYEEQDVNIDETGV